MINKLKNAFAHDINPTAIPRADPARLAFAAFAAAASSDGSGSPKHKLPAKTTNKNHSVGYSVFALQGAEVAMNNAISKTNGGISEPNYIGWYNTNSDQDPAWSEESSINVWSALNEYISVI